MHFTYFKVIVKVFKFLLKLLQALSALSVIFVDLFFHLKFPNQRKINGKA